MKLLKVYTSPIGDISIIEEENKIIEISFGVKSGIEKGSSLLLEKTENELQEYFEGKRTEFDIPIMLKGTEFYQKVWNELKKIPYGETRSYGEIAEKIGNPKASRAVGMANHNNPISIIVPCHRVVGKNSKLVGYAGGLDKKKYLIELERKVKSV